MKEEINVVKPIFYDEKQRRWKAFSGLFVIGVIILVLSTVTLINSIIDSPNLPALNLKDQSNFLSIPDAINKSNIKNTVYLTSLLRLKSYLGGTTITGKTEPVAPIKRFAFYVTWDNGSLNSLKANLENIDYLVPEWITVTDPAGGITQIEPTQQEIVMNYIRSNKKEVGIIPLVTNYDESIQDFNGPKIGTILENQTSRETLINNLYNYVTANNLQGINIDFENIEPTSQLYLQMFMSDLYKKFHTSNLIVSQDLPIDDNDYNYWNLATNNDYIMLMAYDYHWSTSPAGAITPEDWFIQALTQAATLIPKEKLIISLGNYAYDWNISSSASADTLTFQQTMQKAKLSKATIQMDPSTLNPHFDYLDGQGNKHNVWYLDAVTAYNQVIDSKKISPAGYAIWRLGSEDSGIWNILANINSDTISTSSLNNISNNYSIDYVGKGEILKVTATPTDGKREISFDNTTGLIAEESIVSYPTSYTLERWGATSEKKVAITFDDGPDPKYTPQILNILKENNITATFFIIGSAGDVYTDIIKKAVQYGNELGNHTFTHPNLSIIPNPQVSLELNATTRLIESLTGRSTLLFRPPYGEDSEPDTPDQVKPLVSIGNMGYYTVGMNIDPHDWARPGVDQIVNDVILEVESGQGNIILLHDGGGDRTQTVAALPKIISELKKRGYTFVSVSNLIGIPYDSVMPKVSSADALNEFLSDLGFIIIGFTYNLIRTIFWVGTIFGVIRLLIIILLALIGKVRNSRIKYHKNYFPKVSVLIPAWNEEKVIVNTINSLLNSEYPNFDIIVVDDGSVDNTYKVAKAAFEGNSRVKILTKPNGGKSSALNLGVSVSDADIIVGQDADTIFRSDAITKLVRHFQNKRVGAVAGNVKVGNRINLLTNFQALEYVISQNLDRRAFEIINSISVVPGAIGAWRRKLILRAGGFHNDTLAEDSELTLRILALGFRIDYEEHAIAYTEAPDNLRIFLRQRFRWMFGTLQATWKHLYALFRYSYGTLGWFAIPNVLLFQVVFPIISPILDIFTIIFLGVSFWQKATHPDISLDGVHQVILFYALFTMIDVAVAFIAFGLEERENRRLLFLLPLQRLIYKYLMYVVSIKSFLTAIKGPQVKWEVKLRKGNLAEI